jgi:hypothetical protein
MVCGEIMKRGHSTRDNRPFMAAVREDPQSVLLSYDLQLRNRQTSWNFVNSGLTIETKPEVSSNRRGRECLARIARPKSDSSSAQSALGIVSLATSPALNRSMVGGSAALRVQTLC